MLTRSQRSGLAYWSFEGGALVAATDRHASHALWAMNDPCSGRTAASGCSARPPRQLKLLVMASGRWGKGAAATIDVGLTDQTLSCAARAYVATAARRAACLHLKRAMRAA